MRPARGLISWTSLSGSQCDLVQAVPFSEKCLPFSVWAGFCWVPARRDEGRRRRRRRRRRGPAARAGPPLSEGKHLAVCRTFQRRGHSDGWCAWRRLPAPPVPRSRASNTESDGSVRM